MLTEICAYLRNYFETDKQFGNFTISGGSMQPLDFLKEGQYFRIVGSTFNDGVYQYPASNLTDEAFNGAVWAMSLPPSLIALSAEIEKYNEENPTEAITSESFGGYSYSKATGRNGATLGWQSAFSDRLKQWRKFR